MANRRFKVLISSVLVLLTLLLAGGGMVSANAHGQDIAQVGTPAPASLEEGGEEPAPTPTGLLEDVIMTRTPVPTPTPGLIQQEVIKLVARAGLSVPRFSV